MSQIHIADGQNDNILDYITANNIISDTHKRSLENTLETYNFITFADKSFSEFLEKRNRIIIPDEDDNLVEFVIFEAHKYRDREGHKAQVYAHASYLELKKANVIYPGTFTGTASQHGGRALNDTGWEIGIVESNRIITITFDNHTNPYEYLKRIAREFELELDFRVEHNGTKITRRIVNLVERIGTWRGREITFGKDLDGIRRVEKQDIVTALLGVGPEDENGNRLEVLVEDEEALQRWGRRDEFGNLQHLIEPYEIQSDRTEMTESEARQYTRTALDKRINTQITYETTIVDLENVPGMENKQIRFGDMIKIKDEKFNPPLYLEARIFEQDRSIKSKAKKNIVLGDFIEYTEEQVNNIYEQLRKEIRARITRSEMIEHTYSKVEIDQKDEYIFDEGKSFAEAVGIEAEDNAKQFAIEQDSALKIDVEGYADQVADQAEDNAKVYADDVSAQALQQALAESVSQEMYDIKMQQIADDLSDKAGIAYVDGQLQVIDGAIDDLNAEIDTKADGSTVYTISQVDNMINNTVSLTQYTTDINGIVSELSDQSTQIGQNTQAIGLKADQTDLDTVAGTVSDHSAQFLTMADEISARVTADYVQTAIDDVEIGGRNLFIYSRRNVVNHGRGTLDFSRSDTPYGFYMVGDRDDLDDIRMYDVLDGNGFYTVSFDLKGSQNGIGTTGVNINGSNETRFRTRVDNEWERVSVTFEVTNYDYDNPSDNYIGFDPGWQYIWHRYVQVEKGNKATDWTPAPEDVEAEISSLSADLSIQAGKIDLKADSSTVNALGTRISTAESNIDAIEGEITNKVSLSEFNALDGTVTNLSSQVTQQAGLIAQKVDDGEVRSIFTQEAGSFTFDASQVNFTGHIFGQGATFEGDVRVDGDFGRVDITRGLIEFSQSISAGEDVYNGFNLDSELSGSGFYGRLYSGIYNHNYELTPRGVLFNNTGGTQFGGFSILNNFLDTDFSSLHGRPIRIGIRSGGELSSRTQILELDVSEVTVSTNLWVDGHINTNAIDINNAGNNLYIRPASNGEVRVTAPNTTTTYRPFRSGQNYATDYNIHGGGGGSLFFGGDSRINFAPSNNRLYLQSNGDVTASRFMSGTLTAMRASSFDSGSLEEYKEDITVMTDSALDLINGAVLYDYRLKSDVEDGLDKIKHGFVIGEGYSTPEVLISNSGDGISQYEMSSWLWKGVQELSKGLRWLETENQLLKNEIKIIKERIS